MFPFDNATRRLRRGPTALRLATLRSWVSVLLFAVLAGFPTTGWSVGDDSAATCADLRLARQALAEASASALPALRRDLAGAMMARPGCVITEGSLLRAHTLDGPELFGNGGNDMLRAFETIGDEDGEGVAVTGVPREAVTAFVDDLIHAWNGLALEDYLDPDFPQRLRLLADLAERAPQENARVLGIGAVQPLAVDWQGEELVVRVMIQARVGIEGDAAGDHRVSRQELLVRFVSRVR